jgi:ATP/maltotriose-dependent transcriptional regulator MalT
LFEESLSLARRPHDRAAIAWAWHGLGRVAYGQRDAERANAAFEHSLTWFQEAGDVGGSAYSLFFQACLARDGGEHARAIALNEQSLARARAAEDAWILAFALYISANLAWLADDLERGVALYRESLVLAASIRAKWPIAECLWGLAGLAGAQRRAEQAARLHGAERALRETVGAVVLGDVDRYERDLARARAALGEAGFAAAAAEGRAMTLEQAIAYALEGAQTAGRPWAGEPLSRREREVAALIARGLTNRQMAEELVISKQTVDRHVSNILGKLGLATRAQVAAWVVDRRGAASTDHG